MNFIVIAFYSLLHMLHPSFGTNHCRAGPPDSQQRLGIAFAIRIRGEPAASIRARLLLADINCITALLRRTYVVCHIARLSYGIGNLQDVKGGIVTPCICYLTLANLDANCVRCRMLSLPFVKRSATDELIMYRNICGLLSALTIPFVNNLPKAIQICAAEVCCVGDVVSLI